jgi:nicotinamide riboside kinase
MKAQIIALLGAESTGKTILADALRSALLQNQPTRTVAVVPEYLREFCNTHHRTPTAHEQPGIADEQQRRIEHAARLHDIVIADTTALQTAVYSDVVFGDTQLYATAQALQSQCALTLLTAPDVPWQADGLQRDGPHLRAGVDEKLRSALLRAGAGYSVVIGLGPERLQAALASVLRALNPPKKAAALGWHGYCDRCGDAACERAEQAQIRTSRKRILPML